MRSCRITCSTDIAEMLSCESWEPTIEITCLPNVMLWTMCSGFLSTYLSRAVFSFLSSARLSYSSTDRIWLKAYDYFRRICWNRFSDSFGSSRLKSLSSASRNA